MLAFKENLFEMSTNKPLSSCLVSEKVNTWSQPAFLEVSTSRDTHGPTQTFFSTVQDFYLG
jgi:hypothetical protein